MRKKTLTIPHLEAEQLDRLFAELPGHPRVERILELMSRIGRRIATAEAVRVTSELRQALSAYQWVSHVSPTREGYRAILVPAGKGDRWEYAAVRLLLDLTRYPGTLARLRKCVECKERWFYARRDDERNVFCSTPCRVHHYDSDEKRRKEKRKYMIDRYAKEQARKRNPKSGVGLNRATRG